MRHQHANVVYSRCVQFLALFVILSLPGTGICDALVTPHVSARANAGCSGANVLSQAGLVTSLKKRRLLLSRLPSFSSPLSLQSWRSAQLFVSGGSVDDNTSGGDATIPQEVFNLVKIIIGVGVFSLPAGIAAFANAKSAVVPAVALITSIGIISAYEFFLIGRVCDLTKTQTFREAWSESISPKSSWIPAFSVTCLTLFFAIAYSMVLGNTFLSLFASFGVTSLSATSMLLGVTAFVLLPLCLLKSLSALAPFSLVGSLGMVYTAVVMVLRYFGKAYQIGGKFYQDMPVALQPSFGNIGAKGAFSPSASILLGMLSTAYVAHFNAPKFYAELKDNTMPRFFKVVSISFAISVAIYSVMASAGFCTFGSNCSGLVLNNYSTRDSLMSLSRIAVALSLTFSYPLAFVGVRDGFLDLFNFKSIGEGPRWKSNLLSMSLLSMITVLALVIPDVTFILSFAGATLGNALIYLYPFLMFRGIVQKLKAEKDSRVKKNMEREVNVAMCSAIFGIIMGILGAKMAIQSL